MMMMMMMMMRIMMMMMMRMMIIIKMCLYCSKNKVSKCVVCGPEVYKNTFLLYIALAIG